MEELSNRFLPTAINFAKGKKWRPGGNKPYMEILLSLAKLPDMVIPFDAVLSVVPERRRPGIKAVRPRIKEILFDPTKQVDLRRQIAFEDAGFSIEDPLFRYFLSNMPPSDLFRALGIEQANVDRAGLYPYDLGFSFAGEVRQIVEAINAELKAEDVVTFYDFDVQAFLLAQDLESTLGRVYAESCRYYLVFLEQNYLTKVWTKYEKDIMTNSARSRHIVPVYLDPPVDTKVVGIPSTTGMVDLSDMWRQIRSKGKVETSAITAIRNRLVIPMLEKIDTAYQEV
jgi:hypothetical protein